MEMMELKFNSLTDQIDSYSWMFDETRRLSRDQRKHLMELRDTVMVFGVRAEKWVNLVNYMLDIDRLGCDMEEVHISKIRQGDVIYHTDGVIRTVTGKDINDTDRFMGRSIFGDCYKSGHQLVKRLKLRT